MGGTTTTDSKFKWSKLTSYTPYFFIAPFMTLLIIFNFYPFIFGAKISLTDAQFINPGEFIGFKNFIEVLFADDKFIVSVIHSFQYAIGALVTQIPVAFVLAYVLNNISKRFRGVLRASFFVPCLINGVVIALVFRNLFGKEFGIINWFLGLLHLPNQTNWLGESSLSIVIMIAVSFWQWTGFHMVYFLANLQSIDPAIYEVAKLDGASPLRVLWQITVPLMRPAFTFVMVTSAIGALQLFDLPLMLFPNGTYGPGYAARTLVPYIYDFAFRQDFRVGFASAAGWLVFCIIMVISVLQLRFLGMGNADE